MPHGYHWENALAGILVNVTKADADLAKIPTAGVYVGTAGDVTVLDMQDQSAAPVYTLFKSVPAGTILPVKVRQIRSTGTTASDFVAMY